MFDEEESIKKPKPLDLDDLSVEEIEEMIDAVSYTHLTLPTTPYV